MLPSKMFISTCARKQENNVADKQQKSNQKCKGYTERLLGNKNSLPVSLKTFPKSLVPIKLGSGMLRV